MREGIIIGFLLLLVMEMAVVIVRCFKTGERGKAGGKTTGPGEENIKIELTVLVKYPEDRGDSVNIKEAGRYTADRKAEEASALGTPAKIPAGTDKDNAIIKEKGNTEAENKIESGALVSTVKGKSLDEINQKIRKSGYQVWVQDSWERIGIGEGSPKIGESVKLKYGDGNIRVIPKPNEGRYLAVPVKASWKGRDFKKGAYSECYEVPTGIDDNSDYEITQIRRPAILCRDNEAFIVQAKGMIQVVKV